MHNDFSKCHCIVDSDKIVGLVDWEIAGEVHRRLRPHGTPCWGDPYMSDLMHLSVGYSYAARQVSLWQPPYQISRSVVR